jgi:hypothetical protein
VTPRGHAAATAAFICSTDFATVWLATSRVLIFAVARAGITVFAPSAVNPPRMPWTSTVGRPHTRSNSGTPGSPTSSRAPISFSVYSFSSNGKLAHAARSFALGGATSS